MIKRFKVEAQAHGQASFRQAVENINGRYGNYGYTVAGTVVGTKEVIFFQGGALLIQPQIISPPALLDGAKGAALITILGQLRCEKKVMQLDQVANIPFNVGWICAKGAGICLLVLEGDANALLLLLVRRCPMVNNDLCIITGIGQWYRARSRIGYGIWRNVLLRILIVDRLGKNRKAGGHCLSVFAKLFGSN